jgi:hypothetical protein
MTLHELLEALHKEGGLELPLERIERLKAKYHDLEGLAECVDSLTANQSSNSSSSS